MNMTAALQSRPLLWAVFALMLAATAGATFAGWMRFGPEILLTFSENGLSFCF